MQIALIGASGMIGRRILDEALARGHAVTAIARNTERLSDVRDKVNVVAGNALDANSVASAVAGHDVVISTVPPERDNPQSVVTAAHALIDGLKRAGVRRLVVVGGAGSLEVAPGVQLFDTPEFPAAWKPGAVAHGDALAVYRQETELEWTFVSPAGMIMPGERTGQFRIGGDQLLTDEKGESRISCEDFAIALLDEVEKPQFIRRRFTAAY